MSKKKKARKKIASRLADGQAALAVCLRGKCCVRDEARAVLDDMRERAGTGVLVVPFGCLGVCEKGPIVATLRGRKKKIKLHKHVDADKARRLLESLTSRG